MEGVMHHETHLNTIFVGLDVGKHKHHCCAITADGTKILDKLIGQDEAKLRTVFGQLQSKGRVLVIVDQPNTIGALAVAVARDTGCEIAYLPGLAMRKAADLYPGTAKTDRKDAFIIADTGRSMPHTLRAVDRDNDVLSSLKVLAGFDEDLAKDATRTRNRLRGLLTQIHPGLERVFGPQLHRPIVLDVLEHYADPTKLTRSGQIRVRNWVAQRATRDNSEFVTAIFDALDDQSVTVPGTQAAEMVIPQLVRNLRSLLQQRADLAQQVEAMIADYPLAEVLMSMPGVGIKTAAKILLTVGDCSDFPDAAHLASYAGIAPVTKQSGSSIKGEFPARSGNKMLKNALFYSAFAALRSHPASKAYYQRKRVEGKRHNAAVMCLARRRCNVIYAMLTNKEFFREVPPKHPAQAAA